MLNSKELAKLVGPTLSVMSLSELLNLPIWAKNIPPVTYLNGMVLFVAGLAILRIHNRWRADWTFLLTLLGWGTLLGGSFRIFFPEARQASASVYTYLFVSLLLLTGLYLTYQGYRKKSKNRCRSEAEDRSAVLKEPRQ